MVLASTFCLRRRRKNKVGRFTPCPLIVYGPMSVSLQGYQMLKNGKLYGSIIPPDVSSLRIRDVSLGEKLTLQLIALTEHPVGKSDQRAGSVAGDKDSGISGSTAQQDDRSAGRLG